MAKALKWTLRGLGIILLLLILLVVLFPLLFKNRIIEKIKTEANKQLNAQVDFKTESVSLSLIRSFPNVSLGLGDLVVINKAPFEGDTLAFIKEFNSTVDLMSMIRGDQIEIKSFLLEEPYFNLHVLPDGTANWDIALEDKDAPADEPADTSEPLRLNLHEYAIRNARVIYNDESTPIFVKLDTLNHSGSGDLAADVFNMDTKTSIRALTMTYGGVDYLSEVETTLDAGLNVDMPNSKYTLLDNLLTLNALKLKFDGFVAMPNEDDIEVKMNFEAPRAEFRDILSLIPAIYKHDFAQLKSSGSLALDGKVDGVYNEKSYPGFNILADIRNGYFQYPDLPTAVRNVQVNTEVVHPGGDLDRMTVNIKKAHAELGQEPIDAQMFLRTLMTDPFLDGWVKGRVVLERIQELIKLEDTKLSGVVNADVAMKGRLSSLEQEKYDQFDARGFMTAQNVNYATSDLPQPVVVESMRMDFTPQHVKLSDTRAKLGESDIAADGNLNNLLGYYLKGQPLSGSLNLRSQYLNLNPWLADDGAAASQTTPSETKSETPGTPIEAVTLPANIDFNLSTTINRLVYDNFNIQNLKGNINLSDQRLTMKDVAMTLLNGQFLANGFYDSKNPKRPLTEMNLNITDVSIPEMYKTFVTVQNFAPIAQYMEGLLSAKLSVTTPLDQNMNPILSALSSKGVLSIPRAKIENFLPLERIAEHTGLPYFDELVVQGIRPSYIINNGRISLTEPVNFKVRDIAAKLTGSGGLDKTLDYVMDLQVPAKELQGKVSSGLGKLLNNKNINIPLVKTIPVKLLIKGTIDDPKITMDIGEVVGNVKDQLIDKGKQIATEQIDKAKEEAKQRAREEAAKIMQEAEKQAAQVRKIAREQADNLRAEADKAARRLEAEATNPVAKVAAKKAGDKLRQEADQKAKQLVSKADAEAEEILRKAREQAARLE